MKFPKFILNEIILAIENQIWDKHNLFLLPNDKTIEFKTKINYLISIMRIKISVIIVFLRNSIWYKLKEV